MAQAATPDDIEHDEWTGDERAIGRAVLRLVELARRDDTLRRGIEALARAALSPASIAASPTAVPELPIVPEGLAEALPVASVRTSADEELPPSPPSTLPTVAPSTAPEDATRIAPSTVPAGAPSTAPSTTPAGAPSTATENEPEDAPSGAPSTSTAAEQAAEPPAEGRRRPRRNEVEPMSRDALLALLANVVHDLRHEGGVPSDSEAPGVRAEAGGPAGFDQGDLARVVSRERDEVLRGIAARARLKAQVSRAAAERARGGDAVDEGHIHRARSEGASLWMLDLAQPDPASLGTLAEAFDALSDVAELVLLLGESAPGDRQRRTDAVRNFAAVQSAVRVAAQALRITGDEDQGAAFAWLDATTSSERIYVSRHMRLDDPLDPAHLADVMSDVHAQLDVLHEQAEREAAEYRRLKQIRYHAGRIGMGKGNVHDADKIVEAVTELVAYGLPPSNLELRELLLPIADRLPPADGRSREYARVLVDLEGALARDRTGGASPERIPKARIGEVRRVQSVLRGTEVVLVGGERRVEHEREIRDAFGLADVHWFTLSQDPSQEEIERTIARPAVAIVLQLIRWSRHRFGDVAQFAESHGKPFVRVPAGYSVNALAHAISEQASERLVARSPTAADGAE